MQANRMSKEKHSVVAKKTIAASREIIFDAWTKPEIMKSWYVGGKGVSNSTVDLKVGGKYSNEMLIDHDGDGPKSYLHEGEYLEIKRPERLVFTWNSPFVKNTVVNVHLREVDGGTEVTITHQLEKAEDCASHQGGWTFALEGLDKLFSK